MEKHKADLRGYTVDEILAIAIENMRDAGASEDVNKVIDEVESEVVHTVVNRKLGRHKKHSVGHAKDATVPAGASRRY